MRVVNKTRGIVLSKDAGLADSFFTRFKGLMFARRKDLVIKASREGILESSIHMMFMLQQIDVIWVDASMRVVGVERGVMPHDFRKPETWRIHKPNRPALYVVELGIGSAGKTKEGNEIEFIV